MKFWRLTDRHGGETIVDDAEYARRRGLKRPGFISAAAAKVHQCSHCGIEDAWRDSWGWYGSIEQVDNWSGDPPAIPKWCSDACRDGLKAAGLIPRNARRIDEG